MEVQSYRNINEKQPITRMKCIRELCEKSRNNKNMGLCFGSLSLVFSIIVGFAIYSNHLPLLDYLFCFCLIAATVFLYIFAIINHNTVRKVKGLDFYITIEICAGKYYQNDFKNFKRNGYYLIFPDGQEYRIDYSYKGIYKEGKSAQTAFLQAYVGKEYYVFRINDKKPLFALPTDSFCFSPDEFENCGDRFHPVKTGNGAVREGATRKYNVDEDIRRQSLEQYQNYSPEQRAVIDAFDAAHKKVKVMRIVIGIISAANFIPGFFVLFLCCSSPVLSVINICFQTCLFVFLTAYCIRTVYRATCAMDAIPEDFPDYYNLRRTHNAGVWYVFVLVFDLLYYVISLMLMITSLRE